MVIQRNLGRRRALKQYNNTYGQDMVTVELNIQFEGKVKLDTRSIF